MTDEIRATAEHKLAPLERMEPRRPRVDLEFITEHHPKPDGAQTRRGRPADPAEDLPRPRRGPGRARRALDKVAEKLERQVRDHHGKRRSRAPGWTRLAADGAAAPTSTDGCLPEGAQRDETAASERLRVMVVDDHALFRRGLEMVLRQGARHRARRRGLRRRRGDGEGAGGHARHRPDGRPHAASAPGSRPPPRSRTSCPHVEDPDAHDQRRGGRPLRRDQGGRVGLPAEGDPDRGGRRRDPERLGRAVAHQPVDGVEAPHRVRRDVEGVRRAAADAVARGSPTARWRSSGSSRRA